MKMIQTLILSIYVSLANAHPYPDSYAWTVENVNSCQECANLTCTDGKKLFNRYFFYQVSFFDGGEGARAPIAKEENCPFVNYDDCKPDPALKCIMRCEMICY